MIARIIKGDTALIAAGVLVAAGGLYWLTRKGVANSAGYAVGGAATNAALGMVGGFNDALGIPRTQAVIDAANSNSNPLRAFGDWLGGTIYKTTH